MDWILDHLQLIIGIAGAIAYWLNARNKEKAGEPADYDGDGKPDVNTGAGRAMREPASTFDEDHETRRIQEEIRRKIAERSGGGEHPTPPPLAPPPLTPAQRVEPSHWDQAQERRRAQATQAQERAQARRRQQAEARRAEAEEESALILERQRTLASQLAALQARKAEASREANAVWTKPTTTELAGVGSKAAVSGAGGGRDDVSLLSELRNARSLRKAIVLREVLGTPVGMR